MNTISDSTEINAVMDLDETFHIDFHRLQEADDSLVRDFFSSLSPQTLYFRFISHCKPTAQKIRELFTQDLLLMEQCKAIVLTGSTWTQQHGREIIAMGGYYPAPDDARQAEIALAVQDPWQGKMIGTFLFKVLTTVAEQSDILRITASVCAENLAMHRILKKTGCAMKRYLADGVYDYQIELYGHH